MIEQDKKKITLTEPAGYFHLHAEPGTPYFDSLIANGAKIDPSPQVLGDPNLMLHYGHAIKKYGD